MKLAASIFQSSLGKKFIMAGTGAALFGFIVGHLLGNLQIFLGPEPLNAYGHFLKTTPEILWPARLGLLVCVGLHIWAAIKLTEENRAARPVAYASAPPIAASYAARTMVMSGLIVATFILYHLLHYTVLVETVNLTGKNFATLHDAKGRHDVFAMMVTGFRQPGVVIFYLLGVGLLCLHLSHGLGALFQSLGLKAKAWTPLIDRGASVVSLVIFLGYASIPLAVLGGLVGQEVLK